MHEVSGQEGPVSTRRQPDGMINTQCDNLATRYLLSFCLNVRGKTPLCPSQQKTGIYSSFMY